MGISVTEKGSFKNTETYLNRMKQIQLSVILNRYGSQGVAALRAATPIETSGTANSWYFKVIVRPGYCSLRFYNSHMENATPVVILLQYGHGTKNGGYVQGLDFINPAVRPIFEQIAADVKKEVT